MLSDLPPQTDARVLIDFRTSDDAGVYAWEAGPALVQTVDFFTPIVDDPFTYGQIAAANALSDIYAMGGRPVTALAIAGFPDGMLDADTIRQIFLGGLDKGAFLKAFEPDFYFDDQRSHIESARAHVASGHVPFGIANIR